MEEAKKIYCINENKTIDQALRNITANRKGATVVIDDDYKLRGVVSDGDIRRGLVHGNTIMSPINKIMNINCIYLEESKTGEAGEIFTLKIYVSLIPVVDKENRVVDVLVRK